MVKMKLPSLKHRKPIVYISLGIYAFLIALIIFESCLPSGLSGERSNLFAQISAWFINETTDPITPKSIDPVEILDITDTTYLGQDENGVSNIVQGTTTLVSIPFKYPTKKDGYDEYNYKYTLDYKVGNKDDYNVVLSSRTGSDNMYIVDMRVVASEMTSDLYQIDVNIGALKYEYKFHIIPLGVPTNYESRISKNTLKIGEAIKVDTKLLDDSRSDTYLRRYLDESKLERGSLNDEIALIDEYGVIHAKGAGTTSITYGKYSFDITVSNESITKPVINSISLDKTAHQPSLLDYDYIFNDEDDINDYSTVIYASYEDTTLEDQSVTWISSDNQKVKLAPYKYDNDGYPVYIDELNRPCVRVSGYRKKGDVTITCLSNADNSIKETTTLTVGEALPTEMTINITNDLSLNVNEQKVINATFTPKNVNNRNIHIDVDDSNKVSISNNDTSSVTITGLKVGKVHITITSLANNTLKKEFNVSFNAKDKINEDNYEDFHGFMRKAAGHFFLFLVTALVGTLFFYTYIDNNKYLWVTILASLLTGVLAASISELIQYFIPSRGGVIADVGIDSLGYLIGTALMIGGILLVNLIRKKKKN